MKKPLSAIFLLGAVLVMIPSFFERLHSDEVIYWEVAKNISRGLGPLTETGGGGYFIWHVPLPFFIVSPFLLISEHIFTARIVSSFFTIGCAALIFLVGEKRYGRTEGLIGAFVFLFSFQALRFGGRYYLDQYGTFFFLAAIYFIHERKYLYSGVSAVFAVLGREYWLGVYPFIPVYILALRQDGKTFRDVVRAPALFVAPAVAAATAVLPFVFIIPGASGFVISYMEKGAILKNLGASLLSVLNGPGLLRGWAEFGILNCLALAGFAAGRDRRLAILLVPQIIIISLIHGFLINGGVTQYPMGFAATLAVNAGDGLKRLYEKVIPALAKRVNCLRAASAVLGLQFIAFNVIATSATLHGNFLVWGFGYSQDREVISILRREGKGQYIHGIWGAFVDERKRWDWTDYYIQEAIDKDPDWLVTWRNYVDIDYKVIAGTSVKIYNIGPYVMIHRVQRGELQRAVRQKDFQRWALRKD